MEPKVKKGVKGRGREGRVGGCNKWTLSFGTLLGQDLICCDPSIRWSTTVQKYFRAMVSVIVPYFREGGE